MTVKVRINGFGRMGRLDLRAGWDRPELDYTHINEISTDANCSAHLLNFDSIHGVWQHEASASRHDINTTGYGSWIKNKN